MKHEIPRSNWPTALAEAIENADDGDTIVCHNEDMAQLAERARQRMCPKKTLMFEIDD